MAKDFLSDEADAEIKKQKERRKKEGIVLKRNPDKKREKELVQARLLSELNKTQRQYYFKLAKSKTQEQIDNRQKIMLDFKTRRESFILERCEKEGVSFSTIIKIGGFNIVTEEKILEDE